MGKNIDDIFLQTPDKKGLKHNLLKPLDKMRMLFKETIFRPSL
jgi:hypothetical protein